jgi:hypothetical protein
MTTNLELLDDIYDIIVDNTNVPIDLINIVVYEYLNSGPKCPYCTKLCNRKFYTDENHMFYVTTCHNCLRTYHFTMHRDGSFTPPIKM